MQAKSVELPAGDDGIDAKPATGSGWRCDYGLSLRAVAFRRGSGRGSEEYDKISHAWRS